MSIPVIKIFQLGEQCYQCTLNERTYVGIMSFITGMIVQEGYANYPSEVVSIAGISNATYQCSHHYVDVGFTHHKWVCSKCDRDKPEYEV